MKIMITFLGRNTEGIIADANAAFSFDKVVVIARDGDSFEAPDGLEKVGISAFSPVADEEYLVIANGGTSSQLLPAVKRILAIGAKMEAWDLQRDGKSQVW